MKVIDQGLRPSVQNSDKAQLAAKTPLGICARHWRDIIKPPMVS